MAPEMAAEAMRAYERMRELEAREDLLKGLLD